MKRRLFIQDVGCCRIIFDLGKRIKERSKNSSEGYIKKPLKSEYIFETGEMYPRNFKLNGSRKTKMRKKREEVFFIHNSIECILCEIYSKNKPLLEIAKI
jgi:hypothetical protein